MKIRLKKYLKFQIFLAFILISTKLLASDASVLCQSSADNVINFSNQIVARPTENDEFTVLVWNAHKYKDKDYFNDVKKLAETSDILMLQEVIHSTGWQNAFASHLPFSFSFFKSFCTKENQATGVQSASRFPLLHDVNLVSPDLEPITNTPKVTGVSRIEIPGHGGVLLVNTHALNFNVGNTFENQIDQIARYIAAQTGPVIWAGDFNTWNSKRLKYLTIKTKKLGLMHINPVNDDRNQILDHIYVRGFSVVNAEVLKHTSSDHRPLVAILKFL